MKTIQDHNGPRWLAVKFLTADDAGLRRLYQNRPHLIVEGWYVVRTCPCHYGEPVTLAYPNRARARHARRVLLKVSGWPGTTTSEEDDENLHLCC